MKIGVLIRNFNDLRNWELRIIEGIIRDDSLELSLLIKDGRKDKPNTFIKRLNRLFKSKNIIGGLMFTLQKKIESFLFTENPTVNREKLILELNKVNSIDLFPIRKGFLDVFDLNDANKIKKYNLDILFRFEFGIIKGEILNSAKQGIWSFHHADNSVNRGGPAGFWEVVLKQPSIGVTLQKLTPELDGGFVIDKSFFNPHWSYVKTNQIILEGSVNIFFKNIKKLQNGKINYKKSPVYYNPLYKKPDFGFTLKYLISFYSTLISKFVQILDSKILGARYSCWTLFIGKGDFLDSTLFRIKGLNPSKNEFWADPFIFMFQEKHYIFFENYDYKTQKGKISCGRIDKDKLVDIVDVLERNYHLSYPFIFEENQEIFLMPETSSNKRLEIYKCIEFPSKWELYTTAFEGEKVIDATFYSDENKNKWLFINKADGNGPHDSELHIYKVNSPSLKDLEPHKNNPVIINSKVARNAGAIFKYNDEIYRPSQANIEGVYGRALNINRIKILTLNDYVEETITTTFPNFQKGLTRMHHLHQSNNIFVFDAAFRRK